MTQNQNTAIVPGTPDNIREMAAKAITKANSAGSMSGLSDPEVRSIFQAMMPQVKAAIPKHLTPERVIQMCITMVSQNPAIKNCTPGSILGWMMAASTLGFKPVPALGYCYAVPYKNTKKIKDAAGNTREIQVTECQFQIGYKGFIDLARRSGQIETIYAYPVHDGDTFSFSLGLTPDLKHVPAPDGDNKPLTHAYAVVKYKDGGYNFIVLTKQEIERLRKRNPMQRGSIQGAWASDYDAMACAKALKQLHKWMPLSDEMMTAVQADENVIEEKHLTPDNTGIQFVSEIEDAEIIPEQPPASQTPPPAPPAGDKPDPTVTKTPDPNGPIPGAPAPPTTPAGRGRRRSLADWQKGEQGTLLNTPGEAPAK